MGRKLALLAFWFKFRKEQDVTKSFLVKQMIKGFRKGSVTRDSKLLVSFSFIVAAGRKARGRVLWPI